SRTPILFLRIRLRNANRRRAAPLIPSARWRSSAQATAALLGRTNALRGTRRRPAASPAPRLGSAATPPWRGTTKGGLTLATCSSRRTRLGAPSAHRLLWLARPTTDRHGRNSG